MTKRITHLTTFLRICSGKSSDWRLEDALNAPYLRVREDILSMVISGTRRRDTVGQTFSVRGAGGVGLKGD